MHFIELFLLALALAMDAFAVSISTGLKMRCTRADVFRMSFMFGLFQFLMPVIGWFLGLSVRSYIEAYDHWVAFILLAFIGGRMVLESLRGKEDGQCSNPTRGLTLLLLAIATSLDAMAVGISMAMLKVDIWWAATVIGLVCFVVSAFGMRIGLFIKGAGEKLGQKANIIGGLVLIAIGLKILYEHGVFG